MAVLEYCAKHNMIAYIEKIKENAQFHETVDFLSRSSIFYALTECMMMDGVTVSSGSLITTLFLLLAALGAADAYEKKLIQVLKIHTYDNVANLLTKAFDVSSTGRQQLSNARHKVSTVGIILENCNFKTINNISQIHAKVADKPVVITEASISGDLLFNDVDGIDSVAEGEDSRTPTESQPTPSPTQPSAGDQPLLTGLSSEHDSSQDPRVNLKGTGGSGRDQGSFLETVKDAQAKEILTLKARNKKLEKRPNVSTPRQEFSTASPTTTPTTTTIFDDEEMTLADTLIKLKDDKAKDFVPIGFEEDKRMIKDMNKKAKEESNPDEEGILDYKVLDKRFPIINWESKFYHYDRHGAEGIYYRIFKSDGRSRWIKTFSEMVTSGVHILMLEDGTEIHMLAERSKDLASPKQTALALAIPEQTATGKEISNPFIAESLPKTTRPT
nr:hypothetical protein [Tanacetum cinerariifolium]